MPKPKTPILTGCRFDKYLAIGNPIRIGKHLFYECICDCGVVRKVRADALIIGRSKSCGCHKWLSVDLSGMKFNKLTVLKLDSDDLNKWVCLCDCGKTTIVFKGNLTRGHTTSCGCYQNERRGKGSITHGMTKTSEFAIWQSMKQRCYDKNCTAFRRYGARGIHICRKWRNSFDDFFKDMGARPSSRHSIERRDNNKNYSPDNCYWGTPKEQARNRCSNRKIEYDGEKITIAEFAERFNILGTKVYNQANTKSAKEILKFYNINV